MGKIEKIEQEVQALSPDELAQFRAWFLEYDWAVWDGQIERDAQAGRLDALAAIKPYPPRYATSPIKRTHA